MLYIVYSFFFFKQKTAYEMRISDWSSDVCSSDLRIDRRLHALAAPAARIAVALLDRLVRARRRARGHCGAAETAVFEEYIDLDRGVAAAIEDLAGMDVDDCGHGMILLDRA